MQKIDFIKMHGLGNDFVIIDNRIENIDISKKRNFSKHEMLEGNLDF